MFEGMEFGISIGGGETIDLFYSDEFLTAMEACVDAEDVKEVISITLLMILRDAGVDTRKIKDLAGEFDVDYLTFQGYQITVASGLRHPADGRHLWIDALSELLGWAITAEDVQVSAVLSRIEVQSWADLVTEFAENHRTFLEHYMGTFDSEETAVQQYAEDYEDFDSQGTMADFIDWRAYAKHLTINRDVALIDDSETGMVHMWREE